MMYGWWGEVLKLRATYGGYGAWKIGWGVGGNNREGGGDGAKYTCYKAFPKRLHRGCRLEVRS